MNFRLEEVDLQTTLRCNLKCDFCSVRANEHEPHSLPLERILGLIDEAAALGAEQLHLTGGEPTLRKDLPQMVSRAKAKGLATRLITNGTLLDRSKIRELADAGLGSIMVSIDALEKLHDELRGVPGSFQKALSTVQLSLEEGLTTRISSVAFKENMEEIPLLMERAASLGVPIFSIFLGSPLGRGMERKDRIISPGEWQRYLQFLQRRVEEGAFGSEMRIIAELGFSASRPISGGPFPGSTGDPREGATRSQGGAEEIHGTPHGHEGYDRNSLDGRGAGCATLMDSFDYLLVRGDGNLYQCVFFMHEGEPLGNLTERSIADILEDAKRRELYRRFTELPEGCEGCSLTSLCGGGCRGYAMLYFGEWHRRDPRCGDRRDSFFPVCPIAKLNLRNRMVGGSSEHALKEPPAKREDGGAANFREEEEP